MKIEDLQLLMTFITLAGVLIAIYKAFRDPDVRADKEIDLLKARIVSQEALTSETVKTNQNCIHSLEKEVSGMKDQIGFINVSIGKLETIIDERIPKKQ